MNFTYAISPDYKKSQQITYGNLNYTVNIKIYPKVKLEASIGPKVFMMKGDSIEYKYSFIFPDHDFYQPSLHI